MTNDLNGFSTARRMIAALRAGEVSAVELLEMHLSRVERIDGTINSIVVRDFDRARRDARTADERRAGGDDSALLGLPVTIKESIDVEGLPSTAGVEQRRAHRAPADALTVRRLRAAGAVVFGKTNVCTWLADYQGDNPIYGRTLNPWNADYTSGGSSAGSAALAAGLTPLDLGSDLGGSIRVPAAFCGLWGHKPSDSLVPNSGHFPGSALPSVVANLAVQGPHARSAGDVQLMLNVIAGPDVGLDTAWQVRVPPARHQSLKDFRVAVMPVIPWVTVDPQIVDALQAVAQRLRACGLMVTESAPEGLGDLREYYRTFRSLMWSMISARWPAELRRMVIDQKSAHPDEFHTADIAGIRATAAEFLQWQDQRQAYRAAWRQFFGNFDILLTPVTIVNAFPHTRTPNIERRFDIGGKSVDFEYMNFYPGLPTLCGQPATVFPAGFTREGLPIGLQAIGPLLEDYTPLHFAQEMEREFGGFKAPPGAR